MNKTINEIAQIQLGGEKVKYKLDMKDIPPETKKEMDRFFFRTSIPRIIEEEKRRKKKGKDGECNN